MAYIIVEFAIVDVLYANMRYVLAKIVVGMVEGDLCLLNFEVQVSALSLFFSFVLLFPSLCSFIHLSGSTTSHNTLVRTVLARMAQVSYE
jgi:hypothetical protein